jgi:hypothetical protein
MVYGMSKMTHRTTFALDEATIARIRRLAETWEMSQAAVIRRVVAEAAAPQRPDPIALLDELHRDGGGLDREAAEAYLSAARDARKIWRSP